MDLGYKKKKTPKKIKKNPETKQTTEQTPPPPPTSTPKKAFKLLCPAPPSLQIPDSCWKKLVANGPLSLKDL